MIRKQNHLFVPIFFHAFSCLQATVTNKKDNHKSEWDLAKKSNGKSLYYKWIIMENSIHPPEMKTEITIYAGISTFLKHFSNFESYSEWAAGIKKCSIKQSSDSIWLTHTMMNYPWPLKQEDLVTRHLPKQTVIRESKQIIQTT